MAYDRVIGNVALEVKMASAMGMDALFVQAFNATTGIAFSGKMDIHMNMDGQWQQLVEILHYCGRTDIGTPEFARNWYTGQTKVTFIAAIRKYLDEVFFPELAAFINKFLQGSTPVPSTGSLVTLLDGFKIILTDMNVTLDGGKVSKITI